MATEIKSDVPLIDVSPYFEGSEVDKQRVARTLGEVCEEIGFFGIVGHGVEQSQIDEMYAVSRQFFELPLDEKTQYAPPSPEMLRGYRPPKTDALAKSIGVDTPPDLVEVFTYNRLGEPGVDDPSKYPTQLANYFYPNVWPARPSEFKETWLAYYQRMEELAASLMRLCALALGLPENWFDDKIDKHSTNLIVNYYPPVVEQPEPGQLRRGAHTDWGDLTILYQDDNAGGLQRQDKRRPGEWVDVPAIPGSYVVNIGDLLSQWTNDRWVSTMHRVVTPPQQEMGKDRISIPFFHQPNLDALIECIPTCIDAQHPPKYQPITSGEWFVSKHLKTIGHDD